MIKKFNDFIISINEENKLSIGEYNTIGDYIESLFNSKDEFVVNIISYYVTEFDSTIKLSNAINLLDDDKKIELLKRVTSNLECENEDDVTSIKESYGINVLNSFLKFITMIGQKDINISNIIPLDFLIFLDCTVNSIDAEIIINRFKSLSNLMINFRQNSEISFYYGINNNCEFEYGYYYNKAELFKIGVFKLSKSSFNAIKLSELKSLKNLQKNISTLSFDNIKTLIKVKLHFNLFNTIQYKEVAYPLFNNNTLTFAWREYGNWENGILSQNDIDIFNNNIIEHLKKLKCSNLIKFNVKCNDYWIYLNIITK